MDILRPDELERIERDHASGLPARAIIEIFRPHRVRLSEATFRKYIQAGLLPRSRRVGKKGKHQGSQGLYPVEVVRRINAIKKMMAAGSTLSDIKRSFVFYKNHIDQLDRGLCEVLDGFASELKERNFGDRPRREMSQELDRLRSSATALVEAVSRLGSQVTARGADGFQA